MLIFLSPAKSLDYKTPPQVTTHTLPAFLKQSEILIKQLRKLSPAAIATLMDISDPLALLNFNRFADWSLPFTPQNAKQAALAFDGDVYDGLAAKTLSAADLDFAQQHDYSGSDPLRLFRSVYDSLSASAPGKPVLMAEHGFSANGADAQLGRELIHFHNGIWAAPFSALPPRACCSRVAGMPWPPA